VVWNSGPHGGRDGTSASISDRAGHLRAGMHDTTGSDRRVVGSSEGKQTMADKPHEETSRVHRPQAGEPGRIGPDGAAQLVEIDPHPRRFRRTASSAERPERAIRSTAPVYRWVCPCQNPPVLLATYGPNARINIKVRDRYWHLQGFGMVEAICPRCAAEHMLDMRMLRHALEDAGRASRGTDRDAALAD